MDQQKDNNQSGVPNTINTLSFMVLKTERLTAALYLVTSLLSDNEPLKWKLRDKGLGIMLALKNVTAEHMADYGQDFVFYKNIDLDTLTAHIADLVSLIEIGLAAGSISTMNLALLKQEYVTLSQTLNDSIRESMRQFMLSGYDRHMLATPTQSSRSVSDMANHPSSAARAGVQSAASIPQSSNQPSKQSPKKMSYNNNEDSEEKNERHNKIKTFLKDKGWMSIKDIASVIPSM